MANPNFKKNWNLEKSKNLRQYNTTTAKIAPN